MQRLYGTAWFSKAELDAHLAQVEEAKRRDHRVLGKQLELFLIDPEVGSGLVFWLPKGAVIRRQLENFLYDELLKRGYLPVYTPVIGNVHLYETSGHFPYYKDSQFPPIELEEGERYLLRPMNCPHHITIYKSKPRSYRELPLRLAEFGTVHRYEQSGELSGMIRVRGFTQDDAHIFCTEEQVAEEFRGCLEMTQFVLKTLGLDDYRVRLGFSDPKSGKHVGSAETWQRAEAALESVCREMDLPNLSIERGEAAFYGPKADFVVADCIGRPWQLGTVQLDYNLPSPQRFGLEYIGRRQSPPPAGDDSPGAVRVVRAVRGHVDRALCRGLPPLAGPGAGAGAGGQPEGRRVRPPGRIASERGWIAGVGRLSGGKDRLQNPRRPTGIGPLYVRPGGPGGGNRPGHPPRPSGRRPGGHAARGGHHPPERGNLRPKPSAAWSEAPPAWATARTSRGSEGSNLGIFSGQAN